MSEAANSARRYNRVSSARNSFDKRVLILIDRMSPQELTKWWFQGIDNIFLEGIQPGRAFSPGLLLMSDGNGITATHTVIDELYVIFSEYLTQGQRNAISQGAEKKLKNLNILTLHDNYPALGQIHGPRPRVVPESIVGVTDGDELVGRYMDALLRFTEGFKEADNLKLSTLKRIQEIHTAA